MFVKHTSSSFFLFSRFYSIPIRTNFIQSKCKIYDLCRENKLSTAYVEFNSQIKENNAKNIPLSSYNILIDGLCNSGSSSKAFDIFNQMVENKVKKDEITFNSLIKGFSKENQPDKALELLNKMKEYEKYPNFIQLSFIISSYGRLDQYDKISDVIKQIPQLEIKLTTEGKFVLSNIINQLPNKQEKSKILEKIASV